MIRHIKEGFCIQFFRPKTRPKTFLQCFALEQWESKAKHCRNVLGRKNQMQNQSLRHQASFSVQTRPHPIKMPWKNPRSHDEREGRGQPKKDFSVQHYLLLVIYEITQSSNIHLVVTFRQYLGNLSWELFVPRKPPQTSTHHSANSPSKHTGFIYC